MNHLNFAQQVVSYGWIVALIALIAYIGWDQ